MKLKQKVRILKKQILENKVWFDMFLYCRVLYLIMLNSLHGEIPRLKVDSVERAYAEHSKYFLCDSGVSNSASKSLRTVL